MVLGYFYKFQVKFTFHFQTFPPKIKEQHPNKQKDQLRFWLNGRHSSGGHPGLGTDTRIRAGTNRTVKARTGTGAKTDEAGVENNEARTRTEDTETG